MGILFSQISQSKDELATKRLLAPMGLARGVTAHDAVHDAFVTLPPYNTWMIEGEAPPV